MRPLALLALAVLLVPAADARAVPVLWTLGTNWILTDAGVASGSFVFDADTGLYSQVSIVTTAGNSFPGGTYVSDNPNDPGIPFLVQLVTASTGPYTGLPSVVFEFNSALTNTGGQVVGNAEEFSCLDATCTSLTAVVRGDSSGLIHGVPVPEPGLLGMLGLWLFAHATSRKGRCLQGVGRNPLSRLATGRRAAALGCGLALALLSANTASALPVPAGLRTGDTYHLVFTTSVSTTGLSSNLPVYNGFVQSVADAAGIGASQGVTWSAIVSTAGFDARTNAVVGNNTPVYNMRAGSPEELADGFADFWDGVLDAPPGYDENGQVSTAFVWTGSNPSGTRATGSTLGHGSGTAWVGHAIRTDANWISHLEAPTFEQHSLYALSSLITVPEPSLAVLVATFCVVFWYQRRSDASWKA